MSETFKRIDSELFKKIDSDTLEITRTETEIMEESRTEIQTQIDYLEISKIRFQETIVKLKAKLAVLDKKD